MSPWKILCLGNFYLCACHFFFPVHFNSVPSDSTEQALLAFSKAGKPHKSHIKLLYVYALPLWFLDNCLQLVDTVKIQPISANSIFQDPESCIPGSFKELLVLHSILLQLLLGDHYDLFLFLICLGSVVMSLSLMVPFYHQHN